MIGALVAAQCDAEGGPGFSFSVRGRLRETLHLGKAVWRHDADPFNQRIPECDGTAKTVKERKRCHDGIFTPKIEHGAKLLNVPKYVSVTQHDSFRFAGGAAGEEQYRLFPISRFG